MTKKHIRQLIFMIAIFIFSYYAMSLFSSYQSCKSEHFQSCYYSQDTSYMVFYNKRHLGSKIVIDFRAVYEK